MAVTRLTDVIIPSVFAPAVVQASLASNALIQSGIMVRTPQFDQFARGEGSLYDMPYWNDISGSSNVSTDDPAQNSTPNKITMGYDRARKMMRNNSWSSADLVAALATQDPIAVIRPLVANYWNREQQTILIQLLAGVFASTDMAGNVLGLAVEDVGTGGEDAVLFDAEIATNAFALLGDRGQLLTAFVMHSRVFYNLQAAQVITFLQNPVTGQYDIPTYLGRRVIVDDSVPRVAGTTSGYKYTTYLFGRGALAYGEGTPKVPIEAARKAEAGNGEGVETLHSRRHFIMHPRGVRWTDDSMAGPSATNAELATAANWQRVWDPKDVLIVAVTTNG